MKTVLKAMISRLNNAEEQISDLEDKTMEITQSEQQTESKKKRKRKKKESKQYKRPMGYYKACQSTHNRDSREREGKVGQKYI